jgi:MFS family permease
LAQTNRSITLAALLLSLSMAALEATVAATAMPTIIAELGGIQLYGWVTAAYLLAATVTVPMFGKLADLKGRKPILLVGIGLFVAGSLGSGGASTIWQLVAWRVVQGLGAGAMQPVALTVVGDIFSLEERGRVQGYFSALWGFMGIAGPLLGGLIVRVLSWRWVFYINVPSGLAAAALLWVGLHERVERRPRKLDLAGAATITLASLALLGGSDGVHWPLLPIGALLIVAFVFIERRAEEPVLPMALITRRLVAVASATQMLSGGVMIATVTYVPLFVQGVRGGSPTEAGGAIAPMLVGWPIAAVVAGRTLARTGFRGPIRLGAVLTAASSLGLALVLGNGPSIVVIQALTLLFGLGLGLSNTALLIAVQTSVGWSERGVATASALFFRTMGGALAVGSLGAVLSRKLEGAAPPGLISRMLGPERASLPADQLEIVSSALSSGLRDVFTTTAVMGVLALVSAMVFPVVNAAPPAAET